MSRTLGEFEQLVLFAIVELGEGAYGASIAAKIEESTKRRPSSGATYTTLERLENRGFVSSAWGDPTAERGGRRRKYYALQPAGARLLARTYEALVTMGDGLLPEVQAIANREGDPR